jgi:DNA replication protein DnaC
MASREQNKEEKSDPLSECKNFYVEITPSPYPEGIGKSLWAPENFKLIKRLEIGDCVFHYLTSESRSKQNKIIVGMSRVSKKPVRLSKEELIKKVQEIGEPIDRHARKWLDNPKYTSFYFVELSNYIDFPRKIGFKEFTHLTGITKSRSLKGKILIHLAPDRAKKILELAFERKTPSRGLPMGVGKLAWSYNNWSGIDEKTSEKWRNLKDGSSYSYVRETGFAFEWWNFYEGFHEDYYYGYIEWGKQTPPKDFKNGLILFISRNPDDGNMYFIGFYGGADISPTPYDTGKNIRDLIPAELEKKLEDYWERGGSQECKEKCEELLKDVKEGAALKMNIRAKKELSTVFLSEKYIKISQTEDFGEEKWLGRINFRSDIDPEKIRRLLERALEEYKKILENTLEPKEREYAEGVIKKIRKVLSIYFSYSEINCDEVCKEILGILKGYKKQVVLYGVPGTGKTYIATRVARALTGGDTDNLYFVTFHPSYSYEEFVEGIRARATGGNGVEFRVEPGVFKVIVARATCGLVRHLYENGSEGLQKSVPWDTIRGACKEISKSGSMVEIKDEDVNKVLNTIAEWARSNQLLRSKELVKLLDEAPKYVLVIDEINRGDMGRVFGELITLLEEDKRLFGENYIYVTLPYSKARFFIPTNLYILGTMNSSDRSIAFVDYALRRRFAFYELQPDEEKVPNVEIGGVSLREFFEYLNKYLEDTLDRDHRIGHSYFMTIKGGDEARDEFWRVWFTQIRPLLVEYFYGREGELKDVFGELYTKSYIDGGKDLDENLKKALESLKNRIEETH